MDHHERLEEVEPNPIQDQSYSSSKDLIFPELERKLRAMKYAPPANPSEGPGLEYLSKTFGLTPSKIENLIQVNERYGGLPILRADSSNRSRLYGHKKASEERVS